MSICKSIPDFISMPMNSVSVIRNATLATCQSGANEYGLIPRGAVVFAEGVIKWCGDDDALPEQYTDLPTRDVSGRLLTPSLIDCHTHIVHGGNRAGEFEKRLNGVSYAQIAAEGGGIVSTMESTRLADVDELVATALPRVDSLCREGVSTIEIKSGYGLDVSTELNMLRAARRIATLRPLDVHTSFLGAHALPAEYKGRADDYLAEVCIPALHQAHDENLVDAVDGFCESIAFSVAELERVFSEADKLGLPVKVHAEQLSLSGGTQLAARHGALSADHLEYLDEAGIKAMAAAGTVAVLLPGAFYTLRETNVPPVDLLRHHSVPIAIATDCNPGSSPMTSLLLTMNMACTLFGLTPEEALLAVTQVAARALGLSDRGVIAEGQRADFALWDVSHPAELSYRIGFNPFVERIF